jgi:hypothetical protein
MFNFGAGRARLIPAGGGQPVELGVVQSASVELKVDLKELRGPYRYPIAVADGKGTASGKVMFMQLWPSVLGAILSGTVSTGAPMASINEAGTVPAATTYTVTLAFGATLVAGSEIVVVNIGGTSVFYKRVASGSEMAATLVSPLIGAYSINNTTGIMTFAAGDASRQIQTTYLYTPTVNTANATIALAQVGMNTAPTFQLALIGLGKNVYTNQVQQFIIQLNACLAPSLKLDFKLDDFTGVDLDYQAFIDVNGNLGNLYLINSTS